MIDMSRLSAQALEMLAIFEDENTAPISVDLLEPPSNEEKEAPALATLSKSRAEWSLVGTFSVFFCFFFWFFFSSSSCRSEAALATR
jgi:hypothetical protein